MRFLIERRFACVAYFRRTMNVEPAHRSRVFSTLRAKITQKSPCDENSRGRELACCSRNPRQEGSRNTAQTMSVEDTVQLRSGQKIPRVGLGTWQAKSEEVRCAVHEALRAGYRHFDTAFNYSNEEAIGEVLNDWLSAGRVSRDDLFITTKLPHIGNRAGDVAAYLQRSLNRLRLRHVDLYLVHVPFGFLPDAAREAPAVAPDGSVLLDAHTDLAAVWKALEQQVEAGKIKGIGVSNFNTSQMDEIMKTASIPISVLQVELHAHFQQKKIREYCEKHGIVVTAYSPLGSPGAKQHFLEKYNYSPTRFPDVLGNTAVIKLANKYNKKPAQILLRHLVQSGIVVIPKSANPQRIKENFEIFDFLLSDDEMQQLNDLDKGEDGRIFDFLFWKGVQNHPQYPFKQECKDH